jgi:hypothetical protein
MPAGFDRYAFAVAAWASNLPCIMKRLHPALALYSSYHNMGCEAMASWQTGEAQLQILGAYRGWTILLPIVSFRLPC